MNFLRNIFTVLRDLLVPREQFSWHTLLLLSLFSWIMALLATTWVRNILASCGWIFLILGTAWLTSENPVKKGEVSLGHWITAALISLFLFSGWTAEVTPTVWISWPILAALIAVVSSFIHPGPRLKPPKPERRPSLAILVLSYLLISCWFQFYFTLQAWLQQYPSILADDFQNSSFVIRLPFNGPEAVRGTTLLDRASTLLQPQINGQPWAKTERILFDLQQQPQVFEDQVMQQMQDLAENQVWNLETRILPGQPDYTLQLLAIWRGPGTNRNGYYLQRSCQVSQVQDRSAALTPVPGPANPEQAAITLSRIECEPTITTVSGQPQ